MQNVGKILVYHLWPLAWGSIKAMTLFLSKIKALGADYVWLSPINQSPRHNHGYDVSDYYRIDDRLGNLRDFDEFVRTAHAIGLKVIMELVIDSTSIEHRWFTTNPGWYIWETSRTGWKNLLDHQTGWQFEPSQGKYYLHLLHPTQADLNWFPNGVLNRSLVEYYRNVMLYWMTSHGVDGFRLGQVQLLNKDLSKNSFSLPNAMVGRSAVTAINELSNIYGGTHKCPFLMLDLYDEDGKALEYYSVETDVEYVTSRLLKTEIIKNTRLPKIQEQINRCCERTHKFMLDLESHDSPRLTSQLDIDGKEALNIMFGSNAHAVCIYQGQELGLKNPSEKELSLVDMLNLDARAAMRFEHCEVGAEDLRKDSWANTRLPLPLDEYAHQEEDATSVLNYAKHAISTWKSKK